MGPRSDERGNGGGGVDITGGADRLQWGRALMSAEMTSEDGTCWRLYLLQWGRALMSAEMMSRSARRQQRSLASMGPRSDERGNRHGALIPPPWYGRFNGAAL